MIRLPGYRSIRYGEKPDDHICDICNNMERKIGGGTVINICNIIQKPVNPHSTCPYWNDDQAVEIFRDKGYYREIPITTQSEGEITEIISVMKDIITELVNELNYNPRRDQDDDLIVDQVILRAKNFLHDLEKVRIKHFPQTEIG